MKAVIIPKTTMSTIRKTTSAKIETVKKGIINNFIRIGEECIKTATEAGSYRDRTGNLRSSIGYVILVDGSIYQSAQASKTKDGDEGLATFKKVLPEIQGKYKSGIALIVVAGMSYAVYVESRGSDVLTSAELQAEKLVKQLIFDNTKS